MPKGPDNGGDDVLTQEEVILEDPTTQAETVKEAEAERKEARATDDPNDDIAAATTDVDREVSVNTEYTIDAEAPEEATVEVTLNPNFKQPIIEEFTDDSGVPRGKVAGYEAPSDVKVYSAVADAKGVADEDGYVTLPATVPVSVAADLAANPAVEVAE